MDNLHLVQTLMLILVGLAPESLAFCCRDNFSRIVRSRETSVHFRLPRPSVSRELDKKKVESLMRDANLKDDGENIDGSPPVGDWKTVSAIGYKFLRPHTIKGTILASINGVRARLVCLV
jgi:hypothetical protein